MNALGRGHTSSDTECLDHVRGSQDFLSSEDKEWILGKTLAEALNWREVRPVTPSYNATASQ